MVDRGALLLDVREPDEWYAQHVPKAMFRPMGRVRARQEELVCRSGGRSAAVSAALRRSGFDAVNLGGGMCAWAAGRIEPTWLRRQRNPNGCHHRRVNFFRSLAVSANQTRCGQGTIRRYGRGDSQPSG